MKLLHGDCLEVLRAMHDCSVDSVVTDPPYGLKFMNKHWDYDVPSVEVWTEVLRVLKPGGHLLSFGGTRTYHRMVVAIEDAGFEIRDQIQWLYGSGFPKSHNVALSIDKQNGAKPRGSGFIVASGQEGRTKPSTASKRFPLPNLISDLAKQWDGWGTALKPANEPIVLARKPFKGTVAKCVEQYGTGALNIDGCRVGTQTMTSGGSIPDIRANNFSNSSDKERLATPITEKEGRWPANVILDEEAGAMLDEQSGELKSGKFNQASKKAENTIYGKHEAYADPKQYEASSGGASRFFYCAKASKSERNAGCNSNNHPTVKPIKLMRYLCRLITPPNGTVLDPYMGSGTTGIAAKLEGFEFIGIEREAEYVEIAEKRISNENS